MTNPNQGGGTAAGVAGGTLLTIVGHISSQDVVKTALLASLGAVVSFGVSLLLKWVLKKARRRTQ